MKKLLSVLLTLVMAVCLVNINNSQIKAEENDINTMVVYNAGSGEFMDNFPWKTHNIIPAATLATYGISAQGSVVTLDGGVSGKTLTINAGYGFTLYDVTKVIVKGTYTIVLNASEDYAAAFSFGKNTTSGLPVEIAGDGDNAKLIVTNNNDTKDDAHGLTTSNNIPMTLNNIEVEVACTGDGPANNPSVYGGDFNSKITMGENSSIVFKGFSRAADFRTRETMILGADLILGSDNKDGTNATDNIDVKQFSYSQPYTFSYCLKSETHGVKYLKAVNASDYNFTYDGSSWTSIPNIPISASKDDNIVIKNTGSNVVTVNFVDGTTKTVGAGETYTYQVKYNVKITTADLNDTARTIKVYDAIQSNGINFNGTEWQEYNPITSACETMSEDRKSELGISHNSGTTPPTVTLSKNLINVSNHTLFVSSDPLNIVINDDITLMSNSNNIAFDTANTINIDGKDGNKLFLIADQAVALGVLPKAGAKFTLNNVNLICENNYSHTSGACTASINNELVLGDNCIVEITNKSTDPDNNKAFALYVVSEPTNAEKYDFFGKATLNGTLKPAIYNSTTHIYQVESDDTDELVNAKYIIITPKAKPVDPTPSPSNPKDESCEKVIGPTWHWNESKGICEDYGVVGTSTR